MTDVTGRWRLTVKAPIGSETVDLTITERDGRYRAVGSARGQRAEIDPLPVQRTADGARIRFTYSVTQPIKANAEIDVTVTGDRMHGKAKAGLLLRVSVEGTRVGDA